MKAFLEKNSIPVLGHPPYSPEVARCDFYLFSKDKSNLKGKIFERVESVKVKATETLNKLTEKHFSTSLDSEKFGWSGGGIAKGSLLKVIKFWMYLLTNKKFYDVSSVIY